jgi:hypothetical protein
LIKCWAQFLCFNYFLCHSFVQYFRHHFIWKYLSDIKIKDQSISAISVDYKLPTGPSPNNYYGRICCKVRQNLQRIQKLIQRNCHLDIISQEWIPLIEFMTLLPRFAEIEQKMAELLPISYSVSYLWPWIDEFLMLNKKNCHMCRWKIFNRQSCSCTCSFEELYMGRPYYIIGVKCWTLKWPARCWGLTTKHNWQFMIITCVYISKCV